MPLVKERLGEACKSYTVDKGIAGGAPGAPATYVGMCHIFVDSLDAFQSGMASTPRRSWAISRTTPTSRR